MNSSLYMYIFFFWCLHPVHLSGYIRIKAKFGVVRFHSSPKGVAGIRTRVRPTTKVSPHHHWANTYLVEQFTILRLCLAHLKFSDLNLSDLNLFFLIWSELIFSDLNLFFLIWSDLSDLSDLIRSDQIRSNLIWFTRSYLL